MELYALRAHQLRELLDKGEISSVELTKSLLERIQAVDQTIGSYITVREEEALQEAEEADRRIREGRDVGPLTGIPVSLKDNICTEGTATTCASKILAGFVPPYDATVTARLKAQGAPILGKLNLDEFAMGSSTETSAFGHTRNPWDPERVPGGSSGGPAAAVAADAAIMALGSDTGGSIRQPAAFCGIVGVKPTYGLVSRYGLVGFASSLDQIGPMTKDVRDAALLLSAVAGHDPMDSTSFAGEIPDYMADLDRGVEGMVVGLPQELFEEGIAPQVKEAVEAAVRQLEELGARVEEVSLPHIRYAQAVYQVIAPAEASSNLGRFDGVRFGHRSADSPDVVSMFSNTRSEGFGTEVKRRIILGILVLTAERYETYYMQALRTRTLIRQDFEKAFQRCDVLAAPTTPTVAFRFGERQDNPLEMYRSDLLTVSANLAGVPALSVPCGLSPEGLPIGLQLIGPHLGEAALFRAAAAYESAAGWVTTRPRLEVE